jgi:hypothetical protein
MYDEFTGISVFLNESSFSKQILCEVIKKPKQYVDQDGQASIRAPHVVLKPGSLGLLCPGQAMLAEDTDKLPEISKYQNNHPIRKITNITCGFCYSKRIITINDITIIFYGKITNYSFLSKIVLTEDSDSEETLIINMYFKYGLDYTLQMIEGEFTFILLDQNIYANYAKLYVVRDGLGSCPLYTLSEKNTIDRKMYGFAFSKECFRPLCDSTVFKSFYNITEFSPGTYSEFTYSYKVLSHWNLIRDNVNFFHLPKLDIFSRDNVIKLPNLFPVIEHNKIFSPIVLLVNGFNNCRLIELLLQTLANNNYDGKIYTYCVDLDPAFISESQLISRKYGTNHICIPDNITECYGVITEFSSTSPRKSVDSLQSFSNMTENIMFIFAKYISSSLDIKRPIIFSAHDPTIHFDNPIFPLENDNGTNNITSSDKYNNDILLRDLECRKTVLNYHSNIENQMNIIRSFHLEWYRPFLNETYLKYYFSR